MKLKFSSTSILLLFFLASCAGTQNMQKQNYADIKDQQKFDADSILTIREGMETTLSIFRGNRTLIKNLQVEGNIPSSEARNTLKSIWASLCDYYLAADIIDAANREYPNMPDECRYESFRISRCAMLAKYRFALDFISEIEKNKSLAVILNDANPETSMPSGTYSKFKLHYLNIIKASEFTAFELTAKNNDKKTKDDLSIAIDADRTAVLKMGRGKGEIMTLKNAGDIIIETGKKIIFPAQKSFSNWAGDAKVRRRFTDLISEDQIKGFPAELQPGDILLERREWYLTNVGIPGFWTHAAIYIGSAEERKKFFAPVTGNISEDNAVESFEDMLSQKEPDAYKKSISEDEHLRTPRVIEAVGEGVLFTTLEHSASCDSIAVLRPNLTKDNIAKALLTAFHYASRPYDFNFNSLSDSELFCSELVYKAYEPSKAKKGINFEMSEVAGRKMLTANGIAAQFASEADKNNPQMSFVLFYDGNESKKVAQRKNAEEFLKTFRRAKWDIFIQGK